jgi:Piwi domain
MYSPQFLISLNFLSLKSQDFEFHVYRKKYMVSESNINSDCFKHSLPIASGHDERSDYWISLVESVGFEKFKCHSRYNDKLTLRVLKFALEAQATAKKIPFSQSSNRFNKSVEFPIAEHSEGWEMISMEPYFLSSIQRFGFLIDFKFRIKKDIQKGSRRVQQLSLSLSSDGKSNSNFYVDRIKKIQVFVKNHLKSDTLFPVEQNNIQRLEIEHNLYPVEAKTLSARTYIFGESREDGSSLSGVRKFGPLECIQDPIQFHFIFSELLRDDALELYSALNGKKYSTFPGVESFFKLPQLSKRNITSHKLTSFDRETIKKTIADIKASATGRVMLIAILPNKHATDEYISLKYYSLEENIPAQIVTADLIRNESTFKWSVSGIGLQIFSKLGGKPWKVKSNNQNCLIIGIGQAHKIRVNGDGRTSVEKYFSYSILMDSSGIYRDLKILGESSNQSQYLAQLKMQIKEVVVQFRNQFGKFVIHTPFKLRFEEINAIKEALEEFRQDLDFSDIEFVVIKINEENKFFGYDKSANSLVPPESTYIQISKTEFLIWFEGIKQSVSNISKRYSGPTHIEFYYASRNLSHADRMAYLQDIINLSGANWRGFNAKLLPISIYYCKLIAWKIKDFREAGYQNIRINTSTPWFL